MTSKDAMFRTRNGGGRISIAAAAALLVLVTAGVGASDRPSDVTVREENGVYTVAARLLVAQSPAAVMAVLTDYESIPRFMPDVRISVVRDRLPGRTVVEQEAVSSVLMFSKRVHLVLEIDEQPHALLFRDRCGRSFSRYQGSWRVLDEGGQTVIEYELIAEPSFDVPGFMVKRLLRRDSGQMIDGLRREIAARVPSIR